MVPMLPLFLQISSLHVLLRNILSFWYSSPKFHHFHLRCTSWFTCVYLPQSLVPQFWRPISQQETRYTRFFDSLFVKTETLHVNTNQLQTSNTCIPLLSLLLDFWPGCNRQPRYTPWPAVNHFAMSRRGTRRHLAATRVAASLVAEKRGSTIFVLSLSH